MNELKPPCDGEGGDVMTDNRTTELREKLTEHGVDYEVKDLPDINFFHDTRWNANGVRWCFTEFVGATTCLTMCNEWKDCTPEQAIAATLGSELNPDGLPVGLTISEDGELLNWRGENYVKQSTLGSNTKPCYATDYTHEHCKYSVNRGWTEDTRFYISTPVKPKGGTLTAEQVRECVEDLYWEGYNDGYVHRGHGIEETDWQTITDKLNAAWNSLADDYRKAAEYWQRMYEETLAERTCECVAEYAKSPIDGKTIVLHRCSACHELMRPHMAYCPNCGAKVMKL